MWGGATTRQQLQQSITLLQALDEVLELPKENNLVSNGDTTHRLSISRENEIASNLAFLSAISDSHNRVIAVWSRKALVEMEIQFVWRQIRVIFQ
jgi:metallophosphoesterase superfamily enzyme